MAHQHWSVHFSGLARVLPRKGVRLDVLIRRSNEPHSDIHTSSPALDGKTTPDDTKRGRLLQGVTVGSSGLVMQTIGQHIQ